MRFVPKRTYLEKRSACTHFASAHTIWSTRSWPYCSKIPYFRRTLTWKDRSLLTIRQVIQQYFSYITVSSVNSKLCRNSCKVKLALFSQLPHFHVKKGNNHIFCKLYIIIHLELRSLIDGFQSKFFHMVTSVFCSQSHSRPELHQNKWHCEINSHYHAREISLKSTSQTSKWIII